jgi:hypothetical protein
MPESDEDLTGASWQVTLLRSYRTGELPDIEGLRLTSFLSPLSECVSDLAKLLRYVGMVESTKLCKSPASVAC